MKGLKQALPSIVVIAIVVGIWWAVVAATQSAIFPTPWAVVTGTLELARDGTLWEHIGASLMRVGAGFGHGLQRIEHPQRAELAEPQGHGGARRRHLHMRDEFLRYEKNQAARDLLAVHPDEFTAFGLVLLRGIGVRGQRRRGPAEGRMLRFLRGLRACTEEGRVTIELEVHEVR